MAFNLLAAFVVFAIATLCTPGPNNVMLMTSGLNFGFARTLPHRWCRSSRVADRRSEIGHKYLHE